MRQYKTKEAAIQSEMTTLPDPGSLSRPEGLTGFQQTGFSWEIWNIKSKEQLLLETPQLPTGSVESEEDTPYAVMCVYSGKRLDSEEDRTCGRCGAQMHAWAHVPTRLYHLPSGSMRSVIETDRVRYRCPVCGATVLPELAYQAPHHRMTLHLYNLIEALCASGFTLTQIAVLTGVHRHTVKAIDKRRLENLYTENGALRKPERQARILGIDEFKLHDGPVFATVIMDLETAAVLWVQQSKKKQVVYDFIEHVGLDWMEGVEAVCCDMNADFEAAFREKCPHLTTVFDRFHIVKNFNEGVVSEVRKDEYRRLKAEGDAEGARRFKHMKYLTMARRETLARVDAMAAEGKLVREGSELFSIPDVPMKGGRLDRYNELIENNKLLFIADYVKEALAAAYAQKDRFVMEQDIREIIEVCRSTENKHFEWFARLLENHMEGITAHAVYPYSSGRVEGMNNKIKTIRRKAYGFHDDEYFFLKIIDGSRSQRG